MPGKGSTFIRQALTKSNFRARIEKITATNSNLLVNPIQIGKINLCPNSYFDIEENNDVIRDDQIIIESAQKKIKRETIPRLVKLGLTAEQIAEALDLPLPEVKKIIAISN